VATAVAAPKIPTRRPDLAVLVRGLTVPRVLLGVSMVGYAVFYIVHLSLAHDRFWTTDYDLGIFDQSAWLLAHGKSFITIRGLSFWGHHLNPAMALFAPFYWLGAGPRFLNAAMVLSFTAGSIAVFRIGVHHLKNEWLALPLSLAFLLHTSSQFVLRETFHPEVLAIAPMLFAYLAVLQRRWAAYALWIVFAVLWKEDVAITAAMFGVVLFFRGHRRQGAWTAGLAILYYFYATQLFIPAFSPADGAFYASHLGDLGDSPQAVLRTAVTDPGKIVRQLDRANTVGYLRDLGQPYAFVPFLAPVGIVIGLPQTIANLLTTHSYSWSIRWHYVAMPLFGFTVSLVEGVAFLKRQLARLSGPPPAVLAAPVVAVVLVASLVTSALWSPSYGRNYRTMWPLTEDPRTEVLRRAVDLVPPRVPAAASSHLVTHLAHRERIYTFPNPWIVSYWGIDVFGPSGRSVVPAPHDPASVQWIAVDRRAVSGAARTLLESLIASGEWEVHLRQDEVVVISRR
jgi:uncharacterized membrane protein